MKTGLAVDSVRMKVKITALCVCKISGCNTSCNVETVCFLYFIA
jgi:hypothetical protein